jgi:hypothetical protein
MSVAVANQKAQALARRQPKKFFGMSQNDQAKAIGCSWKTWSRTDVYREAQRQGKIPPAGANKTGGDPGSVSLTPELENTLGVENPALSRLIHEQEEDAEPSPLDDDDAPRVYNKGRRRPRGRRLRDE